MATFLTPCVVRQGPSEEGATTRRGLLGGSAALAGASALAEAPSLASAALRPRSGGSDPVLVLCRRYWAIDAARHEVDRRLNAIRAGLVAEWGEPMDGHYWPDDAPGAPELRRLIGVSNNMTAQLCDVVDTLAETPATTAAGMAAKLRIALEQFSPRPDAQWHEDIAWAFMADAARLLEAGRAA